MAFDAHLNQQVRVNHMRIVDDVNFEIQIQRQPGELYQEEECMRERERERENERCTQKKNFRT